MRQIRSGAQRHARGFIREVKIAAGKFRADREFAMATIRWNESLPLINCEVRVRNLQISRRQTRLGKCLAEFQKTSYLANQVPESPSAASGKPTVPTLVPSPTLGLSRTCKRLFQRLCQASNTEECSSGPQIPQPCLDMSKTQPLLLIS